jgi:1,4-alpha-glucan branching enzyme
MHIAFLLIAHAPYLRQPGRQPAGEERLHALIAQGLLPLVELLADLHSTGLRPRVALACSPLLTEQLADPVVRKHFVLWMEALLAEREATLADAEATGDGHAVYLERFYLEWGRRRLQAFEQRFARGLPEKLRDLATAHVVEPLAGTASHAYLPLLGREESVRAQLEHGLLHTTRHLGRPEGLWLPGCGWRPAIEPMISDVGLRYVIADPSSLPPGLRPAPLWISAQRLAACFPDEHLARHVWSDELGYPGDPLYRDPHDPYGYTARGGAPYDPYDALRRAQEHATHFVMTLVAEAQRRPRDDLALVLLDVAQIGPRWVEGPTWLQAVLTLCATHSALELTTPGAYLRAQRPRVTVALRAGSWSAGGHAGWEGAEAEEYWQALHAAEAQLVHLAASYPSTEGELERALNQAARELLLAQTSDWPAMLSAGSGAEVGAGRWRTYLARFAQLTAIIHRGRLNEADRFFLDQLEEEDGPFSNLNYRIFAP